MSLLRGGRATLEYVACQKSMGRTGWVAEAAFGHPVNEADLESTIENILNAPPPRARSDHPFATGRFSRHLGALVGGVV